MFHKKKKGHCNRVADCVGDVFFSGSLFSC